MLENMVINMGNSVVLIGFMATGKSTIANELKNNGFERVSTDEIIIEKVGLSINEIFEKHGESYFRQLEDEVILELVETLKNATSNIVVDCGGGIVKSKNFYLFNNVSEVCFLDTDFETITERLVNDTTRPLAKDKAKLQNLYDERYDLYKSCSDFIVKNDKIDIIVKNILKKVIK